MRDVPVSRYLVFLLIAGGGCGLDLWSKTWAFQFLGFPAQNAHWIWDGRFSLEWSLNEGALFGYGKGFVFGFATLSVIAASGILYWLFLGGGAKDAFLNATLALITGGILGNLYDRLGLPGLSWPYPTGNHEVGEPVYAVRDWIHWQYFDKFDWPVFNLADSYLVCGAALLIWHSYFRAPAVARNPQPAQEAA